MKKKRKKTDDNQIYLKKIDEIGDKVYELYNLSDREDLVMFYSMRKKQIYSYIYSEFYESLSPNSQQILAQQFKEAKTENKIVLFIEDELRRKLKSFTI